MMIMSRIMTVMTLMMMTAVSVMARGAIRNIGNGGIDGGGSPNTRTGII